MVKARIPYFALALASLGPITTANRLAERGWPGASRWTLIVSSTIPFVLQHLQFHGYRLTPRAALQLAFRVPMGIALGRLREESGSQAIPPPPFFIYIHRQRPRRGPGTQQWTNGYC